VIDHGVNGIVVDPENIDGVVNTICRSLADQGQLAAMGKAGYVKAQSNFTDLAMARGILSAITIIEQPYGEM
jgi:glycosyltransferase involved in cell wall biosynthesis